MKKNIGKIDKIARFVLGIIVVAAGVYLKSWWGLLGLIFIGTAFINWCPIYSVFGLSTCKKD